MIRATPPVRFITAVLAVWTGLRVIFWSPVLSPAPNLGRPDPFLPGFPARPLFEAFGADAEPARPRAATSTPIALPFESAARLRPSIIPPISRAAEASDCGVNCLSNADAAPVPPLNQLTIERAARRPSRTVPSPIAAPGAPPPSRFSLSAWAQWRSDLGTDALANDGELGGSQAGLRLRYRVARVTGAQVALSARLSRPIERDNGAEGAVGLSISPGGDIPVELTVERRIALDDGGRDAWAVGIAGGVYRQPLPFGLGLDGYAQAGIVGAESRDLYGDAALIVSRPVPLDDRVTASLGGGLWAGAQPGVSRVDIGPEASLRLPAGGGGVRLSVSWRQRIAGSAAPGSGPVLTVGADF